MTISGTKINGSNNTNRNTGSKWIGLGSEDEYLKLYNKFQQHLKMEGKDTNALSLNRTNLYQSENIENHDAGNNQCNQVKEIDQHAFINRNPLGQRTSRRGRKIDKTSSGMYSFSQIPMPIRHKQKVETIGEKLEKSRQTRALDLHKKRQQKWNEITSHLSSKLAQKPSNLLLHRSEVEYRQKIEDIELMEIAKELRGKDPRNKEEISPHDWQMSLRGSDEMLVQVGGSWPYPLYVPVRKRNALTSKRAQQIIRKMTMRDEAGDNTTTERRSALGVRTLENKYVRKKYGKEISKFLNHNAADYVDGLLIEGVNLTQRDTSQFAHEEEDAKYSDIDDEPEEIEGEVVEIEPSPEIVGPGYRVSTLQLAFSTTPTESSYAFIKISNIGSCTLKYEWKKLSPITPKQKERAGHKFHLTSPAKGSIHAGTDIDFYFSFKSNEEGIFSIAYEFSTSPVFEHAPTSIIQLRGITIAQRDDVKFLSFSKQLQSSILQMQMQNAVQMLIDGLPEPTLQPSDAEVRERRYKDALRKKFQTQNPSLHFISDEIVAAYHQLSQHVLHQIQQEINIQNKKEETGEEVEQNEVKSTTSLTWDFSLSSLLTLIQKVSDEETKQEFFAVFQDLLLTTNEIPTVPEERRLVTPILQNDNVVTSLKSRLNYNAFYNAFIDGIDQICETCNFVNQHFTEDPKSKGKAPTKSKKGGPAIEEDEEIAKQRIQLAKTRQIHLQAKDAITNTIDAALSSIMESDEQISAYC